MVLEVFTNRGQSLQWKVLILDEASKSLVDSVVKQDDILQEKVTSTSFAGLLLTFWNCADAV